NNTVVSKTVIVFINTLLFCTKTLNLPEKAIKAECYWNISKTSIPTGFFLVSEFWDINPVNDGVSPKEYVV
ncbi:TPA: hypothetical protein ACG6K6_005194, partial [Escherichia coli]